MAMAFVPWDASLPGTIGGSPGRPVACSRRQAAPRSARDGGVGLLALGAAGAVVGRRAPARGRREGAQRPRGEESYRRPSRGPPGRDRGAESYDRRPSGTRPGRDRGEEMLDRRPTQKQPGETLLWGGVEVTGAAVKWLKAQEEMSKGFRPSPIQESAMARIYNGESCAIQAPTGTGKTLCYLLPMLQRFSKEAAQAPVRGLRFLILVPSAALQIQTAALARALLGPHLAENVTLMRRDVDNTSTPSNIVIATPRQIRDLLQTPLTQTAWTRAIANVDMVVVDEADRLVNKWNLHQRKVRQRQDKEDPAVMVLRMIEEETTKENRREEWQLVAASATMSRRTHRNLKFSAGIDLTLIRSPGSLHWQAPDKPKIGQYGDGSTSWPAGLRHRVRVPNPFRFPKVMSVAAQTIVELQARRVLVVLATTGERGKAPKSVYGLNLVLGQLNFRLQEYGPGQYEVLTCREAIDEAAKLWSPEGSAQRTQRRPGCQVVVANCEAIRGIHLDNVDAVVLLGDPSSVADYLHCVGRTCRYQPGAAEPVEGMAVSIVNDQAATRLLHWGTLSGFKLVEVPLRTHLTTGGPAARPPSKEREEEEDLEDLSEEDFFLRELELKDLERSKGRRARDFQDLEDDLLEESEAR